MPAGYVRDHRTVAYLVRFHNPVRLPVELIPDRQAAHGVGMQVTVEAFNLPDLLADVNGLLSFVHSLSVRRGCQFPSAVPSGLASTTL